jgi:hypothetical protein
MMRRQKTYWVYSFTPFEVLSSVGYTRGLAGYVEDIGVRECHERRK